MENQLKQGETLFAEGRIDEAAEFFLSAVEKGENNKEAYNNLGVIAIQKRDVKAAIECFTRSLEIDPFYKDAIINYTDLLKTLNQLHIAVPLLEKIAEIDPTDKEIAKLLKNIRSSVQVRLKITVLCLPGLESFLKDIVDFLKVKHDVRVCYSTKGQDIEAAIKWADTIWLEWANELALKLTNHPTLLEGKRVICRLHSYEAFTTFPKQIDWNVIDKVIFVAEHIKNITQELAPKIKTTSMSIIPNGINLEKWKFRTRRKGFNIAYVGSINYKKGSILLPHLLNAVYNKDKRYRLHIAGEIQDPRYAFYFKQMVQDMGLSNNFIMYGKIDDIDTWLEDKNYILSASLLESQQLSLCEAMAKGIKPVIHNFVGAKDIYPGEYVFNTIDEAADMIHSTDYKSAEYRQYISERYNLTDQLEKIDKLIQKIVCKSNSKNILAKSYPLVSVLIATYNRSAMLNELLQNLHNQTYKDFEIVIVNDNSTDDTESVIKKWISINPKIKYINNEFNIGGSYSFDKAYEHSSGEYVLILSDDDLLKENALEIMTRTACLDRSDIIYCDLDLIDVEGKNVGRWSYRRYPDYRELLTELLTTGVNRIPECPLMTRNAFKEYQRLYSKRFISTYYISNLRKNKFSYIPAALYQYRVHANSQANNIKGIWQRNNGVINHINTIVFMYSFSEIFPNLHWAKDRESLSKGYTLIASILYNLAQRFIKGQLYNGLTYEKKDNLYLLFYKYAYIWLKRAIYYGAYGGNVEKLTKVFEEHKELWHGEEYRGMCLVPKNFSLIPDLALLPSRKYDTLITLDLLVLGDGSMPEYIPVFEENNKKILIQVHQLKNPAEIQTTKQYLQSNLVHAVITKNFDNGRFALELLDELELFSIPVLVFVNDNISLEKHMEEEIEFNKFLSLRRVERFHENKEEGLLGFEGLTVSGVLERLKCIFETY